MEGLKKPSPRKKQKRYKSYAAIPMSGPLVKMNQGDWHMQMTLLDKSVYRLFRRHYPRFLSPEELTVMLKKFYCESVALTDVWASLDKPVMRKYIFRLKKYLWALLTQKQVDIFSNTL